MPQLCANEGCAFGRGSPRASMSVGSCCFCLPSEGCCWGACCTSTAGWPKPRPWPVPTACEISMYSFIPRPWCSQDPSSEERFHVELHFSPGVKGCEEDRNIPTGFGFRPASAEVSALSWAPGRGRPCTGTCGSAERRAALRPAAAWASATCAPLACPCARGLSGLRSLPDSVGFVGQSLFKEEQSAGISLIAHISLISH